MAKGYGSEMEIRTEHRAGATIVIPSGDIDLTASPTLRATLKQVSTKRPARLVIDLAAVPYMDSSGVATLVEAMQITREHGTRMVLCSLQDRVRSIFEIARLDTVFKIAPNAEAALTD